MAPAKALDRGDVSRDVFTEAFLLRSVDYGDADRVVTLLSAEFGKVSALARGARRSRKRFGGALTSFALLHVSVAPGRGELAALREARIERSFPGILADLGKMSLAGAAMELVREALPARQPDARLFADTFAFLAHLDVAPAPREELLLAFSVRVMSLMGFEPGLDVCARTGKRAAEGQSAYFDPTVGSIVSSAAGGGPLRVSGLSRQRLKKASSAQFHDVGEPWADGDLSEVRSVVAAFVSHQLGRQLSGASFVAQVKELTRA